jgi:magnesium transporter
MPETLRSLVKAISCDASTGEFRVLSSTDDVGASAPNANNLLWLDLLHPGEDDLAQLGKMFGLHPLAVEDALHGHQRPKIEEYDDFFFLVFYGIMTDPETQQLRTTEVRMFAGTHYLITLHDADIPGLGEAEHRWKRNPQQVEWGIGVLLYSVLDTLVDEYFPVADRLVERSEAVTDRIYAEPTRVTQFTFELLALKRQVLEFRRIIAPERDVLNVLTNRDSPVFHSQTLVYFRDVYDHVSRLADTLDLYRDQITSTMDATLAIASNELNKVMRTLTAMSIILMSDALISGIYGMNFVNIPELQWRFGYLYALALMGGVSLLLWRYFKYVRWL